MIPWANIGVIDVEGSAERSGFYRKIEQARLINPNAFKIIRIPGGNSVQISREMVRLGMDKAVQDFAVAGGVVWGVCAGLVIMASEVEDGPERYDAWEGNHLSLLNCKVRRFHWGASDGMEQVQFETPDGVCTLGFSRIEAPGILSATESTRIIGWTKSEEPVGMVAVNGNCFGWAGGPVWNSDKGWLFDLCMNQQS